MIFYGLLILFSLVLLQDVKYRGVHWILFPLLLGACVVFNYEMVTLVQLAYNIVFLAVLMGALTLYLTFKNGRLINITDGYFSWGDILFLLAICPLFDLQEFMLFFTVGTCMSLLFHLLVNTFKQQKTLPYAGYMAILGMVYVLFQYQIEELTQGI